MQEVRADQTRSAIKELPEDHRQAMEQILASLDKPDVTHVEVRRLGATLGVSVSPVVTADAVTDDAAGRTAYEDYCQKRGGLSFTGDPLPTWEKVDAGIRASWCSAAAAVLRNYGAPARADTRPADDNGPVPRPVFHDKKWRRELDLVLQEIKKEEASDRKSRERSLAISKLQEAIMWLGMDLKALNEPNPYPSSMDPTRGTIELTADGLKL